MEESNNLPSSTTTSKFWNLFNCINSLSTSRSRWFSATTASLLLIFFFISTLLFTHYSDYISASAGNSVLFNYSIMFSKNNNHEYPKRDEYLLNCTSSNMSITCPANYSPNTFNSNNFTLNQTCPEYFRWIHEDLKTWKSQGITREMVESLKKDAHFRLVIVNGTAYVKQYAKAYQTRDDFTLWGILQLLKLYPGRLPDLDLMFQCHDKPSIKRKYYRGWRAAFAYPQPPPQFHYCGDDSTFDIVFPDWSFWGWPEVNVKPWVPLEKDLQEGNAIKSWTSREPYAFWKGNLHNGPRPKLGKCNSIKDWNAQIIDQDWIKEWREGFKDSDLSEQCVHRFKIYMEGNAWSVSEKYILACNSTSLLINPIYYDFFTRSLIPMKHYWPVSDKHICKSIKFAVEWGNNNTDKAQEIGNAGSKFIFDQIKMEHVYDYMFHVLYEYAKLLKFKPTVPEGAVELCSERFACSPMGLETTYKIETMVNGPSERGPCQLPPPYDPLTIQSIRDQNAKIKKQVKMWEPNAWYEW
ncbi:O-glucosyltransferase rumi homolog isoform X2 [Chenopodium quinoa]|uniref:O-glucosyltransferase rumi homolog isoform X2 n=1 Tax=Chenopodium quinoa TaxID=63459 RepID=UPI000B792AA1|nr:O-glucosyltransferase rumi homolog isoform X2 [Chenopodium quinoa]